MSLWQEVHLFPVRHHSPRASAVLEALLDRVRPTVVLVEGPCDADRLIDVLTDDGTVPPVAILAYRTDGTPPGFRRTLPDPGPGRRFAGGTTGSSLWPMASYSPEYVALRWARRNRARAAFIDVPAGAAWSGSGSTKKTPKAKRPRGKARAVAPELGDPGPGDAPPGESPTPDIDGAAVRSDLAAAAHDELAIELAAARATGHRSFEEMWEALIEAPRHDVASFSAALLAYADAVRGGGDRAWHRARDAFMTRKVKAEVDAGVEPGRIAVVVGAAHAAAFLAGDVDDGLADRVRASVPVELTLVPYSHARLAEQTGYGAGNRAPLYYQRAHDAGADYRRATLEVLVDFTDRLRLRGFAVSLGDTIEAFRLAAQLASLRGKPEPGLDEVREAAIATLCRGEAEHVDGFLWPSVIGQGVGRVAARIGRTSLQEEFWREVRERRLPSTDALESISLLLANDVELGTSTFLHRLRVAGIPYASHRALQRGRVAPRGSDGEAAGGVAALWRVREAWEARWTPATDVALVESIALGESLAEVTARVLARRLGEARRAGDAADVLAEAVQTRTAGVVAEALRACEERAATDDDLPSLTRACRALSFLVSYGAERGHLGFAPGAVRPLCERTFARAVLRVRAACRTDDRGVGEVCEALRSLHEVAMVQPAVDRNGWLAAAGELIADRGAHPQASGLAAGLLYLAQALGEDRVAEVVAGRLSDRVDPAAAAGFLAGFLDVNALVLVRSRPVVEALDAFLLSIPADRFRDVLPVLRRALGGLGATERRYLVEQVVGLRAAGGGARQAARVLAERDVDALRAMDTELGAALDDLDDLL